MKVFSIPMFNFSRVSGTNISFNVHATSPRLVKAVSSKTSTPISALANKAKTRTSPEDFEELVGHPALLFLQLPPVH